MSSNDESKSVWSFQWNPFDICCNLSDDASFALSVFYGMFVVNLAIVCIVSQYIASVGPLDISEYYLNMLFFISIVWLIGFALSVKYGKNKSDAREPVKSHHASNRWLKGVVAIFGFSIIIKDTLELFALTQITSPLCSHKALHIMSPILHSPYVFGQVVFLFLFAKHHIQEWKHFARFGIMHIMATNLSVWLATVAGEATEALMYEQRISDWEALQTSPSQSNRSGDASVQEGSVADIDKGDVFGFLFRGNCTCRTVYCNRVVEADKFLFPFLVEFCLISTCLFYVTWKKVGKKAKQIRCIFKPCYKFFQAYKGPTLGAFVLASTITVIILLGAFESDEPYHKRNYIDQYHLLHLYETFLSVCEFANLLACFAGFYLYAQTKKKKAHNHHIITLDSVLLFVCFIGPLIAGMFSVLSLSFGSHHSKAPGWGISLVYPIIDVISTMIQILFIVYGMQFSPTPATSAKVSDGNESQLSSRVEEYCIQQQDNYNDMEMHHLKEGKKDETYHEMAQYNRDDEEERPELASTYSAAMTARQSSRSTTVQKIRIATPDIIRGRLREVLMFLVISNASLWIFLSLDKTVFTTLAYQYGYFGHGVWTTITAITTPLSIFLRMHSSACFFELWSYA